MECRNSQGSIGTDILFTGHRLDSTGLYYYNARYYDPEIGRFISPDTIIPSASNPQAWNKYSYVLNNPTKYADEFGMATWTWTIYKMVIPGPGTLEFLVTTSTDADYIGKWKPTMTRRSMDGFAARDDTVLVELPWTIRP